ncbi:MAG: S8 family peptidase [Actinomycetota bacterium]|nr:S8 family peptidase [Actinomycetota bacterium]
MMKRAALFLALVVIPALLIPAAASAARDPSGRYIVVLEDEVKDPRSVASEHERRFGADVRKVYRSAIEGYAAKLSRSELRALRADKRVATVEPDRLMKSVATQSSATWGIDRIDQRALPLNSSFSYLNNGAGVKAYVIDSGIAPTHQEFAGRVAGRRDFVGLPGEPWHTDGVDCNGHGTHVSGTVLGAGYGVAKGASLVGVRVLDCDGYGLTSEIIAGVDWVTADHLAGQPAVANMSLGGGRSDALDSAVRRSIADGVSYAVAAGNGNSSGVAQDACTSSPARVPEALTISATNSADRKVSWANYGSCVDWFAPGAGITSAWHTSDTAAATISGTSMATPHTAGVAALYLQGNRGASPATVRSALYNQTTKYVVTSSNTGNRHLLYTGW